MTESNWFVAGNGNRMCRTCRNAASSARRRGMTVEQVLAERAL